MNLTTKMKYMALLCLTVILTYCQGAAQSQAKPLNKKVQQLTDLVAKKSIIKLDLNMFKAFVRSPPPKDYSFIVLFTALVPARGCAICQHVYDEYQIVANSFRFSPLFNNELYFGTVDFDEGSDVFRMLRINSAPVLIHFPAKRIPTIEDAIEFPRTGIHAEAIAKWIQDKADVRIRVFRPPNYAGAVAFTLLFSLGAGFLYRRNHLELLYDKDIWATLAVVFCFTMVSGQMWNQITGPPFLHRTENGAAEYIYGESNGQFVLESYIIAVLNAAVVVGLVLMIEAAGGVKPKTVKAQARKKRRFQSVVGLIMVCVFFSLLLSIFTAKNRGYLSI